MNDKVTLELTPDRAEFFVLCEKEKEYVLRCLKEKANLLKLFNAKIIGLTEEEKEEAITGFSGVVDAERSGKFKNVKKISNNHYED